jgi:conjugative relaxase-like TrwC/TraI family protein
MLSLYTLKSAGQAAQYYDQGDYYVKGDDVENNVWFGKGASDLGLEGTVDVKQFKSLLEGKLPDGTVLNNGHDKDGKLQHRPGYDLTFSSCKSASILALVGGDTRIIDAHNNAVIAVLTKIENDMAATRVKKQGVVEVAKTNSLVAALFLHTDSRLLEPNLHTHAVLLNATKLEEQWRTLYGDDFYNFKMALGLAYRMQYAQNLMKIGYEIEQTSKDGLFEIAGIPRELIRHYSSRRVEIEKGIEETGLNGSDKISITVNKGTKFERIVNTTVSSMVTLYSRTKKKVIHKDEFSNHLNEKLNHSGFDKAYLDDAINKSKNLSEVKLDSPVKVLNLAFPQALEHLTSNRHMFSAKELIYATQGLCIKSNVSEMQILKKIETLKASGDILVGSNGTMTTLAAQNIEKENLVLTDKGKDSGHALLPVVASFLVKRLVKDESKVDALIHTLSSKSQFLAIESSNEKQTHDLLKTLVKFTPHCTHYVLSKNHNVAKNVAQDIHAARSFSTHEFLEYTNKLLASKEYITKNLSSVWVINRAEQLTHKEINNLVKNADIFSAKILFTGDSFKASSLQSNPFKQLLDNKLPTATLHANMQLATNLLKDSQITQAFDALENNKNISYIADSKQRFNTACAHVVDQSPAVLLVPNKSAMMKANNTIREMKIDNGSIHGVAIQVPTLTPISLSVTEKANIVSFNTGDIIRFNSTIKNTDFKQGIYYTINDVDVKNNSLSLSSGVENTLLNFTDNIGKKLSVYRQQNLILQAGDHLVWNDSAPKKVNSLGYNRGDTLTVVSVGDNNIQVLSNDGVKTLDLKSINAQHLYYNYSKTINGAHAQQNFNGAVFIEPNSFPNIATQDIYLALKSFVTEPMIFAPAKEELLNHLQSSNQQLTNALNAASASLDVKAQAEQTTKTINYSANNAVNHAIAKLSEREAVFRKADLEYIAYSHDIKTPVQDLEQAIIALEKDGTLIKVANDNYVFKEIYDCERNCLDILSRGTGKLQPITNTEDQALQQIKTNTRLTAGQKEAINTVLTSTDQITLIQGVAGSGKTTMLKEVKSIARDNGFELIGLANTASAKINLHLKSIGADFNAEKPETFIHAGMQSQTVTSFILASEKLLSTNPDMAKTAYPPNTILVLDEASLVSAKAMQSLLNVAEKLDLRMVVIGDDRQLPAIEASRVFSLMLGTAESVVNMNINTRLRTPESLEVMQLIYAANLNPELIDKAFEKMIQNVVEIPDKTERLQRMAEYYTGTHVKDRDEVLPMMPENKDRVLFNNLVREIFKKDGTLAGPEVTSKVMVAKNLTTVEKHLALSFENGDFVRFNANIPRLGIKAGDYYKIINTKQEQLILSNDAGIKTSWNPFKHADGNVEVYREESRELMVGDSIRWCRNFEDKGIINSETAKVLNVKDRLISVELANGKQHTIDTKDRSNQHFDHSYGSTVHVAQGLDKKNPLGLLDGPKPYQVEIEAVSVGSIVVIPGNPREKIMSKVGQVIATDIMGDKPSLTVIDRAGNKQSLENKFVEVYPDFSKTKHQPLVNMCNFLVQATRGDNFIVFVDNLEGCKASLKYSHEHLKQTALEMVDVAQGQQIKTKVAKMTSQVFGIAKPEELKNRLLAINDTSKSIPKEQQMLNLNFEKTRNTLPKEQQMLNLNFEKTRNTLPKEQFHTQLESLKHTLNQDPLRFASQILGSPVTKTPNYANFAMGKDKSKGNLTLDITGVKAGLWCDHRTGEGGDLVRLYALQSGLSYVEAAKKLFKERNIAEIPKTTITKNQSVNQKLQQQKDELARAKSIQQATQLYNSAKPIAGTLAEKYLNDIRGIKSGIPENFKYVSRCWHKDLHTRKPALLIPAYDQNGKLQSVNRIYLGSDANKLNILIKSDNNLQAQATQKAVLGPSKSATVSLNKIPGTSVTYLTEGVENGLSIKQSMPDANISSCFGIGQLKNIALSPETKTVIICADNDGVNLATKKTLEQTVAQLLDQGLDVKLAMPLDKDPSAKYDYNQMLIERGVGDVTNSLSQAVTIKNIADLGDEKIPLHQSFAKLHEQQFEKNISSRAKTIDSERER